MVPTVRKAVDRQKQLGMCRAFVFRKGKVNRICSFPSRDRLQVVVNIRHLHK